SCGRRRAAPCGSASGCRRARDDATARARGIRRSLGPVCGVPAGELTAAQPGSEYLTAQHVAALGEPALAAYVLGLPVGCFYSHRFDAPARQIVGRCLHVEKADVARELERVEQQFTGDER